jgi:hypothetical protein
VAITSGVVHDVEGRAGGAWPALLSCLLAFGFVFGAFDTIASAGREETAGVVPIGDGFKSNDHGSGGPTLDPGFAASSRKWGTA